MADLKAWLAKKKESPNAAPQQGGVPAAAAASGPEVSGRNGSDSSVPAEQAGANLDAAPAQPVRVSALAGRFKSTPKPAPVPAPATVAAESKPDDFDLGDLANSLLGSGETVQPQVRKSQFADEVAASEVLKPPYREIPADVDDDQRKLMRQFCTLIDGVYDIINDPELLGGVIKSIMVELKSNPQYMRMVAKEDVRLWVKAMRDSMGLARIKKTEAKAKRGAGGKAKSPKNDADMEQAFNDLGISFD